MKSKYYKLLMILCIILSISSCIEGEQGPEGPQGEQGEQGIPGTDGNVLINGNRPPEASDGKVGDFYIDIQNSKLYGPKTSDGWGEPTDLQGETGQDGQDGTRIYSGSMAPPPAVGNIGDFYFRTTTAILYGPKRTTGWGSGVNLKGPKGDPGTANVLSTAWMNGRNKVYNPGTGSGTREYPIEGTVLTSLLNATNANSVKDFLVNKGGVLLVYSKSSDNSISQIPARQRTSSGSIYRLERWIVTTSNAIDIEYSQYDWGTISSTPPALSVRFIFIPPGQILPNQRNAPINWSELSYSEIKNLFNLKD